jgi:hypothetical protein
MEMDILNLHWFALPLLQICIGLKRFVLVFVKIIAIGSGNDFHREKSFFA